MLTAGERAPTVAGSPSSTAAWEAYRDLPVSRTDSRGWQQGSHTYTGIFQTLAEACSVSRQFSEPSRIRSCIVLRNVASASWAWGRRRERSSWSAEGMCRAAQQHPFPPCRLAAAGYHNLCLLLQPETAERRIAAHAAQLQLAHIWHRREVLGLHHWDLPRGIQA